MKINFLQNILNPKDLKVISLNDYFDYVRGAKFEAEIMAFRNSRSEAKDVRTKIKNKIPAVTISGVFNGHVSNGSLQEHSGFLCIDFDGCENVGKLKEQLKHDKYTHAVLVSASGEGLAAVIKIDPDHHSEAFDGAKEYYFKSYQQLIDKSCRNVSRLRFLSMDKDLFINPRSVLFKEYPKKERKQKVFHAILTHTEFDELMSRIIQGGYDLTSGEYQTYLNIGFALANEFQERGRDYFHTICQANSKYEQAQCDKQYTYCMRDTGSKKITIASFYHLCKNAGIELKDRASYQLEGIAKMAKKQHRTAESVVDIARAIGLDPIRAQEMATAVFNKNVSLEISGETSVGLCRTFVQSNYDLRYNVITGNIEDRRVMLNGSYRILTDMELNTMFLLFSESCEEKISRDFFNTFIFSEFTSFYNPFYEFFSLNENLPRSRDLISELASCIETDTPNAEKFITHWGVGLIASLYNTTSPLVLVLAGSVQNTGKTEWFRRLLPDSLKQYYAESKLDAGKDDDILMCKKIMIMDDEFGGKSKFESRRLKELTSKKTFSIRAPYGRVAKEMKRIASLCGTTNDLNLINDPTGNRRIVPINVLSVDHEKYNAIPKDALLMALYDLYRSGFKWEFNADDIRLLKDGSDQFMATNPEAELINEFFDKPTGNYDGEFMTNTAIKDWIELMSKQKVWSNVKLGMELANMGFEQKRISKNNITTRVYRVVKKNQPEFTLEQKQAELFRQTQNPPSSENSETRVSRDEFPF